MHLGLDIECGCFAGHTKIGPGRLAEDAALLALTALLFLARRKSSARRYNRPSS